MSNALHLLSPGIPTGFHHPAQGCEERATLGHRHQKTPTLKGLYPSPAPVPTAEGSNPFRLDDLWRRTPRVARFSQPWSKGWNPFGVRNRLTFWLRQAGPRSQDKQQGVNRPCLQPIVSQPFHFFFSPATMDFASFSLTSRIFDVGDLSHPSLHFACSLGNWTVVLSRSVVQLS
jgi:hypothetical protein